MLKFTQCLIVKNEENNLLRALSWGRKIFDEQIVVDTGSEDNTAELAQALGAKVFHFEWIDDFSAARNFAITQCSGDWIFFLDADEYFEEKDVLKLRSTVQKVDSETVKVNGEIRKYNVIETPWINDGKDDGSVQARIFRNVPYLRYEGAIHEQLTALPEGYLKAYPVKGRPAIQHTGYAWSDSNNKAAKAARNFEIAKKALKKSPNSSKLQLYAAEALMDQGKYKKAEEYYAEAMKNSDGSIWTARLSDGYKQWLTTFLRMKDFDSDKDNLMNKAIQAYLEAVSKFPNDSDFDILISMAYFRVQDLKHMVHFFDLSLTKNKGSLSAQIISPEKYKEIQNLCKKLKDLHVV